jgi:hypothetical protein
MELRTQSLSVHASQFKFAANISREELNNFFTKGAAHTFLAAHSSVANSNGMKLFAEQSFAIRGACVDAI